MSRVISVVTAAFAPVPEYLNGAYRSLRDQHLPAGWEWQWVVQQDGHSGDIGDTGLLLAASTLAPGYFIAEPGLLYRKWPGQMTSQSEHTDAIERPARMAIIAERAGALAMMHSESPAAEGRPVLRTAAAVEEGREAPAPFPGLTLTWIQSGHAS